MRSRVETSPPNKKKKREKKNIKWVNVFGVLHFCVPSYDSFHHCSSQTPSFLAADIMSGGHSLTLAKSKAYCPIDLVEFVSLIRSDFHFMFIVVI